MSAAASLLRSWVRIPPGIWIFVCCECPVLSGRGLCDELIARPEESYRLWCVVVCDLGTSRIGAPYIYDISCLRVNDLMISGVVALFGCPSRGSSSRLVWPRLNAAAHFLIFENEGEESP